MEPKKFPGDGNENGVEHHIAISQEGWRDGMWSKLVQQTSNKTIGWIIDERPDQANHHRRQHVRQEEDRAEKRPAWHLAVHQQRQRNGRGQLYQQRENGNQEVVLDRLQKDRVFEKRLVVFQADVVIKRVQAIPLIEAIMRRLDHWHQNKEKKQYQSRKHE